MSKFNIIETNILSLQFKKFTQNPHLDYDMAIEDDRDIIIKKISLLIIGNLMSLTKYFSTSSFSNILLRQKKQK